MKKLALALGVLAALVGGCFLHAHMVTGAADAVEAAVLRLEGAAEKGDWTGAEAALSEAEESWAQFLPYANRLLRHSVTEELTAALTDLREALNGRDETLLPRARRLRTLLNTMTALETLTGESVL